ncbi:hypothetical protein D3C72_1248240 [compost metagenome]
MNDTALMSGCSHRPLAVSGPPCTTFSTPGGRPASSANWARNSDAVGSCSDGLSTKVLPQATGSDGLSTKLLPQATAIGNMKQGSITGKLNAVMPAHTPSGWIRV